MLIYAERLSMGVMDGRARMGALEFLGYTIVFAYIAACIHVFSGLLTFKYGVELLVIFAGLAAYLWLAAVVAVLPGMLTHLALWDAARGVSKAGDGIREWGRGQRERGAREHRREDEADRWYR